MSTTTGLRGHLSRPDRETVTLYGGLFVVVMFAFGPSTWVANALLTGKLPSIDPGLWTLGAAIFGFGPALFAVGYLAAYRRLVTPTSA